LYGHNSKLLVVPGQWVEKGELIALSGSSGRSSGPHCHFEIIKNGQYQNPAKFVGTR
ncbi:MAG: M23 family metallopeptidase, partial [Oscillospiraceae bacterium]